MMIPNKFNGYSADNRRLYNDPTLVVATIANMGSGAAAAATIAEAAAAAAAAEAAATAATATTAPAAAAAEQAAAQAAAQQAGQAGIMQGAAVPPPGVTPPGVPGLGAPIPPAQPLPVASDAFHAQEAARLKDYLNSSTAGPGVGQGAGTPPGLQNSLNPAGVEASPGLGQAPTGFENVLKATDVGTKTGNGLLDGFNLVKKFAGEAYEGYQKAPMPLQALGALALNNKFLVEQPEGPNKDNYKRTPYAGLSPTFKPGGPSDLLYGFANGGITGPVEQMSNMNAIGGNSMYPMANIPRLEYANPVQQRPVSENIMTMGGDSPTDPYTGELKFSAGGTADEDDKEDANRRKQYSRMLGSSEVSPEESLSRGQSIASMAHGKGASITGHGIIPRSRAQTLSSPNTAAQNEMAAMMKTKGMKAYLPKTFDPQSGSAGAGESDFAGGGITYGLGGYSDGGRLLKGPGDGVSDSIPAVIGSKQPARLADGEFVIPARIVSELGNGSTEAGARQLYAMMERIQKGRKKSVGKGKVAVNSKAAKHLPA
jgi:hypothetical protein